MKFNLIKIQSCIILVLITLLVFFSIQSEYQIRKIHYDEFAHTLTFNALKTFKLGFDNPVNTNHFSSASLITDGILISKHQPLHPLFMNLSTKVFSTENYAGIIEFIIALIFLYLLLFELSGDSVCSFFVCLYPILNLPLFFDFTCNQMGVSLGFMSCSLVLYGAISLVRDQKKWFFLLFVGFCSLFLSRIYEAIMLILLLNLIFFFKSISINKIAKINFVFFLTCLVFMSFNHIATGSYTLTLYDKYRKLYNSAPAFIFQNYAGGVDASLPTNLYNFLSMEVREFLFFKNNFMELLLTISNRLFQYLWYVLSYSTFFFLSGILFIKKIKLYSIVLLITFVFLSLITYFSTRYVSSYIPIWIALNLIILLNMPFLKYRKHLLFVLFSVQFYFSFPELLIRIGSNQQQLIYARQDLITIISDLKKPSLIFVDYDPAIITNEWVYNEKGVGAEQKVIFAHKLPDNNKLNEFYKNRNHFVLKIGKDLELKYLSN